MSALLGWVLSNPMVIAIFGGLMAAAVAFFKGRSAGKQSERDKQARARQKAIDTANKVETDVGSLPADKAREELKKWVR
jgi:type II secretory pathway pseudopilin PulG